MLKKYTSIRKNNNIFGDARVKLVSIMKSLHRVANAFFTVQFLDWNQSNAMFITSRTNNLGIEY